MPYHATYIAGTKHHPGASEHLDTVAAGDDGFRLEREPTNSYDPNAVKILHGGVMVGYVPGTLSAEITGLIEAGRIERVERRESRGINIHYRDEEPQA